MATARTLLLLACTTVLVTTACRKDNDAPEMPASGGPTPFHVTLPQWVIDSLGPMPASADNPLTVEGVTLGRHLFYDKRLSDDNTLSCSSCHVQANAFSDPRAFSIGTDGSVGTRNAMAIVNLAWSQNLFWDGRRHTLEEQAHDPVTNPVEMRNTWPNVVERLQGDAATVARFHAAFGTSTVDSLSVMKALAQFERTLVSFNSRFDRYYFGGDAGAFTAEEEAGLALFTGAANCAGCHSLGLMTDDQLRNNGVDPLGTDLGLGAITGIPADDHRFKVPTLRNIAVTAPYMHANGFTTLFDVVTFYDHVTASTPNLDHAMTPLLAITNFTEQQKQELIAFLNTLTDEDFLTDPAFSQP